MGILRSKQCAKTPLYVRRGSQIKQMPLDHLSYIKHIPLEHISCIKETSRNTHRVVHKVERGSPKVTIMINLFIYQTIIFELIVAWLRYMTAWVGVNINSGNGLLSVSIKTFPEPVLTYHRPDSMAFILGHYRLPAKKMQNYICEMASTFDRDQTVNIRLAQWQWS